MKLRKILSTTLLLISSPAMAEPLFSCEVCPVGKYNDGNFDECQSCKSSETGSWVVGINTNPKCGTATRSVEKYCQSVGSTSDSANSTTTTEFKILGGCNSGFVCDSGNCSQCKVNTYASSGTATSCTACPNGSYASPGKSKCSSKWSQYKVITTPGNTSVTFTPGIYEIIAKGAGGGSQGNWLFNWGTDGSSGSRFEYIFYTPLNITQTVTVGAGGSGGANNNACWPGSSGNAGGNGGYTKVGFLNSVADGGRGGNAACGNCGGARIGSPSISTVTKIDATKHPGEGASGAVHNGTACEGGLSGSNGSIEIYKLNECGSGEIESNGSCVCAAGYYKNGSTCTACPTGTYKSSSGNATSCTACTNKPANSSYAGTGATSNSCPWNCNAVSSASLNYRYCESGGKCVYTTAGAGMIWAGVQGCYFNCADGYYKSGNGCVSYSQTVNY
ncbi:MAG: hypothetical protein K6F04_01635 [bacterium]|nr:hypothetical protein [bacterium]